MKKDAGTEITEQRSGASVGYFNDLLRRLWLGRGWGAAQFLLTLLLILLGVAWTRLPDTHAWQVGLSLLLPLLIVISALELEAGTTRAFADDDGKRVKLVLGAASLLVWCALVWASWAILDWCDDQNFLWAGYLNSQAPEHWRGAVFTYPHLLSWLRLAEWIMRWIVVPAKVIPYAFASAQWGWRLPLRRVLRLLWNWRWWLAVVPAALASVALPERFFSPAPHGHVAHQVWTVILKVAATYLLAVICWVLLLGWAAVLWSRQPLLSDDGLDANLFQRLHASRGWIAALALWWVAADLAGSVLPHSARGLNAWLVVPLALALFASLLLLLVACVRSMSGPDEKRARFLWGTVAAVLWMLPGIGAAFLLYTYHGPAWLRGLCLVLLPGVLIPFSAASAQWAWRLPWKSILRVLCNWRWWPVVLLAAIIGVALPALLLFKSPYGPAAPQNDLFALRKCVADVFSFVSLVGLLGWFAVLLHGPLPLAESGDNSSGDA